MERDLKYAWTDTKSAVVNLSRLTKEARTPNQKRRFEALIARLESISSALLLEIDEEKKAAETARQKTKG